MRLFQKKLTDEEYVENARKHLQFYRRFRWLLIPFVMGAIAYYAYLCPKLLKLISSLGRNAGKGEDATYYWTGLIAGILYFTGCSFAGCKAVLFLEALPTNINKLVLKYFALAQEIDIHDKKDAQNVERIRHAIEGSHAIGWLWVVVTAVLLCSFFFFNQIFYCLQKGCGFTDMQMTHACVGTVMGFMSVGFPGIVLVSAPSLLTSVKLSRLLVKYHDLLATREKDGGRQSSPS